MSEKSYQTYLFPLPKTTFFPRTTIPLRIFEPRYLQMVQDALKFKTPIALCCRKSDDDNTSYSGLICGTGHPMILRENPDGTLLIAIKCSRKVMLGERLSSLPYHTYSCFPVDESHDFNEENVFRLNRLKKVFENWVSQNTANQNSGREFLQKTNNAESLIHYGASFLLTRNDHQQEVLESNDINEKLNLLLDFLNKESKFHPAKSSSEVDTTQRI